MDRNCTTLFSCGLNCQAIFSCAVARFQVYARMGQCGCYSYFITFILYTLVNTNSLFCYYMQN
ncbi:hypothetical protein IscW_ISCW014679 [Ixodes scapularis]|uniref:Uncharacterized protein n=1 Tax=Ixodes scapularis TaxID=6945 RepID=B7QH61_IXOSC|nr:hypothetical protein IscW_ISCW014679 [Ixodes scapularis]|eukprot:XP_002414518.1 hypothetical protein IscW_ISCW014679 [Ixodes scapularis]